MKKYKKSAILMLAFCLVLTNVCFMPGVVYAKGISSVGQAKKQAKKQVKGARVVEAEMDYDNGKKVYDVELSKGKKEYNLVFRASDAVMTSYEWEIHSWSVARGKGKLLGLNKAKKLAKKQVKNAAVTSAVKKYSDGIDVYKVHLRTDKKKYELKLHARTGKLLEYGWELAVKTSSSYIGEEKAKSIALKKVGSGTVVKVEFDHDDGVPVYEVEIKKDMYEYELKIHAKTGKILTYEQEHSDD